MFRSGSVDPILNLIYSKGPRALLAYLSPTTRERVTAFVIDRSVCALCRDVTDDDQAVGELGVALADDRLRLLALSAVMQVAQEQARTKAGACRR